MTCISAKHALQLGKSPLKYIRFKIIFLHDTVPKRSFRPFQAQSVPPSRHAPNWHPTVRHSPTCSIPFDKSPVAKRYPTVFRVQRVHDRKGLRQGDSIVGKHGPRVKAIEIIPTGDKWDLDVDDPMTVAGLLADDLAVMIKGPDGRYYMKAGSICVPGSFLPLSTIHDMLNFALGRLLEDRRQDRSPTR